MIAALLVTVLVMVAQCLSSASRMPMEPPAGTTRGGCEGCYIQGDASNTPDERAAAVHEYLRCCDRVKAANSAIVERPPPATVSTAFPESPGVWSTKHVASEPASTLPPRNLSTPIPMPEVPKHKEIIVDHWFGNGNGISCCKALVNNSDDNAICAVCCQLGTPAKCSTWNQMIPQCVCSA